MKNQKRHPFLTTRSHPISGLVLMQKDTERMLGKETTTDPVENIAKGAVKYDAGKSPVFRGLLDYFPRSCEAVAQISAFGASKYAWKGWQEVPDGVARYSDGLVRHLTSEGKGEVLDGDSGLRHAAHAAWNSLARLELMLMKEEDGQRN